MPSQPASRSVFESHPKKTMLVIFMFFFLVIILIGEIYLRATISYNIGYYTGVQQPGVVDYPFGKVLINSHGEPDTEFDLKDSKPRIGYIGDSVNYGIGAGHGYRFSDLLEKKYPSYQHMTSGAVGFGIHDVGSIMNEIDTYELNKVIFLLNLNDILPKIEGADNGTGGNTTLLNSLWSLGTNTVDYFRDRSYFYNYMRTALKNALVRMGYGFGGFKAFEFYPSKNKEIFKGTAERTNKFGEELTKKGIKFCVVILPYEMQISNPAAKKYKALGFDWADDFASGSAQKELLKTLDTKKFDTLDGYHAFLDSDNEIASKDTNQLGQYFVYNKGDKIDWNHPNRAGHKKLADYAIEKGFCDIK